MKKKVITLLSFGLVSFIALAGLAIGKDSVRAAAADEDPVVTYHLVGENGEESETFLEDWTVAGGHEMIVNTEADPEVYVEEYMLLEMRLNAGDQFKIMSSDEVYLNNDDDQKYYGPALDLNHVTAFEDNWVDGNMVVNSTGLYNIYFQILESGRWQAHISIIIEDGYYITGSFNNWALDETMLVLVPNETEAFQWDLVDEEMIADTEFRFVSGYTDDFVSIARENLGKGITGNGEDNLVVLADGTFSFYLKTGMYPMPLWIESDVMEVSRYYMVGTMTAWDLDDESIPFYISTPDQPNMKEQFLILEIELTVGDEFKIVDNRGWNTNGVNLHNSDGTRNYASGGGGSNIRISVTGTYNLYLKVWDVAVIGYHELTIVPASVI